MPSIQTDIHPDNQVLVSKAKENNKITKEAGTEFYRLCMRK